MSVKIKLKEIIIGSAQICIICISNGGILLEFRYIIFIVTSTISESSTPMDT